MIRKWDRVGIKWDKVLLQKESGVRSKILLDTVAIVNSERKHEDKTESKDTREREDL